MTNLKNAISLFRQGDFDAAKAELSEIGIELPEDKSLLLYSGYIALLENRLKAATDYFQKILVRMPRAKSVKALLIDAYYRQDDFVNASYLMKSAGRKSHAAKLDYLRTKKAYETISSTNRTELMFVKKDPLPLIKISINNASPANFIIDTGGGELILDTKYARSLGLREFGTDADIFGGGKRGTFIHSCVDSIQLGDFQVKHIPVMLMDFSKFSDQLFGDGYQVEGILGTCIFYHFLTTLDYRNDKIMFEYLNSDSGPERENRQEKESFQKIPFWMAGDHLMLAKGKVNNGDEMLFLIDTGLASGSFTCPKSTLNKYGFPLQKNKAGFGFGGGGKVKVIPFDIESLSLGGIQEHNLHGLFGPFPPSLEHACGFKIGGLISHEFFRNHTVKFDYRNMTMHIK
jgi:predicted aspartyl protease